MATHPSILVNVGGAQLMADDSREVYRQKLARITLDSMVQFVGLLDAGGTVLEINAVALDAVGIKLSDVEGRPFWTTFWWQVSPEMNATLRDGIARAANGEFVRWDAEIYGRAGGKETIIIDASLCPVKDEHGQVVFITAEGRDITEKKAHEREIARQREELAKLDELKTQFFANISHEFRTPLTLMLGPLDDALGDADEPLGERQRERMDLVRRNGLRLQKLVNTLLDVARVEAGRAHAVYQPTDLSAFTTDLASSFRAACERAGIALDVTAPPLGEPIFVDREMWEKIVLNLISNAFKFTLDGGIAVSVGVEDAWVALRVKDTGVGVPESELAKIFDRFHRVENVHGRTYEGTGIGLSLVQELVKLHGGSIGVDSVVGEGTCFTVRLPLGSAHLPADQIERVRTLTSTATRAEAFVSEALRWLPGADETPQADPPEPSAPGENRARVLIADDNADMRDYLVRLLAPIYEVTAVADGEAALSAARADPPDLILTDVMMPRLDGFGMLQQMRADPALAETPVIVLSARAGEEAKVEGLRHGADDYLVKPFNARELLARVKANIELAQSRAQGAEILRDETHRLVVLNRTAVTLAGEIELERLVQAVTDAATELTGAKFGAFFYNIADEAGESYLLYTLSGASREAFAGFPQPRNTAVFAPTFSGEGVVRSGDIREDPRYGKNAPHHGLPSGHLPVVSYLSAPVIAPNGEVLGGLFLAHPNADMFTEHHELILVGIAAQAAAAFEKARLYEASRRAEVGLRQLNETLEQRVAEEVAERRLLADIVEGTDAYVQVADMNYRWLAINKASADEFERTFGVRPQVGDSIPERLAQSPEHLAGVMRVWGRALAGEEFTDIQAFGEKGPDRRYYELKFNVLRDKDGRQIGAYQFVYDITQRVRDQARLAEAQSALRQAQKLDAMGQLTGGVAHDFNNLLTPIIGSLDMLQRRSFGTERERRLITGALQSAERAKTLVQRLLAFARRQPLQPCPVDVGRLVEGMVDLVASTSGPQIRVVVDVAKDLPAAIADANQLEMAILNLSVNARDAMEQGGTLRITADAQSVGPEHPSKLPAGRYIRLSVADTGIGMDEATAVRAIEPFFSTKGVGKGTGLGLSMAHGLASQLGGALTISSKPGLGANVELWLPESAEPALAEGEAHDPLARRERAGRALLVDDEDLVRMSAADMLTELGFEVVEAHSAEEALKALEDGLQIELLVTDHLMPGMSGVDLAHAVRARWPEVQVVVVSGFAEAEGVGPDLQRLTKPFRQAELAAALSEAAR